MLVAASSSAMAFAPRAPLVRMSVDSPPAPEAAPTLDVRSIGDFGFDPLGLYPQAGPFGPGLSLEERRCVMREQELTHGRTAMLAIFGFVAQEKLTGVPVVEETPQFFLPDAQGVQAELQFSEIARVSFDVVKSLWPF